MLWTYAASTCSVIGYDDQTQCDLSTLLIEESSFPEGEWQELGSRTYRSSPHRIGIGRAGTSFIHLTIGSADHQVYHFRTEEDAEEGLLEELDYQISLLSEGFDCDSISYSMDIQTHVSETREFICIEPPGVAQYIVVMRYGTYVVEFSADIVTLESDDIKNILQDIDERMTGCLNQ